LTITDAGTNAWNDFATLSEAMIRAVVFPFIKGIMASILSKRSVKSLFVHEK